MRSSRCRRTRAKSVDVALLVLPPDHRPTSTTTDAVTIYLDANVLFNWLDLAALDRVALSIVAAESSQAIVVPSVAADEAEAQYLRRLESAARQIRDGQKVYNALFHTPPLTEPVPEASGIIEDWRHSLLAHAKVVRPPDGTLEQAIRREIFRRPPARAILDGNGKDVGATGARDAAIWLTVVDHHRQATDDGHFISADRGFTVRTGEFKPELLKDLEGVDRPLRHYDSVFDFLKRIGELVPSNELADALGIDELMRRAEPVVRRILPLTAAIPHAAFAGIENRYRYETVIHEARPARIRRGRRYDTPSGHLLVVDSVWTINADCFRMEADGSDGGRADVVEDAWFEGGLQLYLPTEQGEERLAQLMSGRMQVIGHASEEADLG